MSPHDPRLDMLFVRYWDNVLTDAEMQDLERRLSTDPAARDWFRFLCLQATTVGDLSAVAQAEASSAPNLASRLVPTRWSRRRVLGALGVGLAAGVTGLLTYPWWGGSENVTQVKLASIRGAVRVTTLDGEITPVLGRAVARGATVTTYGVDASARLLCSDGTEISLAGDSSLALSSSGRQLMLRRGHATADLRPHPADTGLTLSTVIASLASPSGALVTLQHTSEATEVGVRDGGVTVSAPSGESLGVVGAGEMLIVQNNAGRKEPLPATPEEFAWDLTRALPTGWHVGERVETNEGPVVVPQIYLDPYHHNAPMWQVRSNKQWARGFFRLLPDSVVQLRYKVKESGAGQMVVCVRSESTAGASTGVVEYNGAFFVHPRGEWQTLEVRADAMLDNINTPSFGAPWIGFLVIFNTYKIDLGLTIAEFRVTRPGGPRKA